MIIQKLYFQEIISIAKSRKWNDLYGLSSFHISKIETNKKKREAALLKSIKYMSDQSFLEDAYEELEELSPNEAFDSCHSECMQSESQNCRAQSTMAAFVCSAVCLREFHPHLNGLDTSALRTKSSAAPETQ